MLKKCQIRYAYQITTRGNRVSQWSALERCIAWTGGALGEEPHEQLLLVDLAFQCLVGPLLEDSVGWLVGGAGGGSGLNARDEDELEEEFVGLVGAGEVLEGD